MSDDAGSRHVLGPASAQRSDTATFEFKAPDSSDSGGRGGGYPRWRSWEARPHTSRQSKEDVYVPVHRLCAVAWLFPGDWTAADILDSGELVGADVHHDAGMPAVTVESGGPNDVPGLLLADHGTHSEITQAEMRAYGADAKRDAEASRETGVSGSPDRCDNCDTETDVFAESPDWRGRYCLACAKRESDGATIEIL